MGSAWGCLHGHGATWTPCKEPSQDAWKKRKKQGGEHAWMIWSWKRKKEKPREGTRVKGRRRRKGSRRRWRKEAVMVVEGKTWLWGFNVGVQLSNPEKSSAKPPMFHQKFSQPDLVYLTPPKTPLQAPYTTFLPNTKPCVTPQIRLTRQPSQNVMGHPVKSVNPNLTQIDLLLAS